MIFQGPCSCRSQAGVLIDGMNYNMHHGLALASIISVMCTASHFGVALSRATHFYYVHQP
jgi:hypothetical protein